LCGLLQFNAYAEEEKKTEKPKPIIEVSGEELGVLRGRGDFHNNVLFPSGERCYTKVGNWETGGHYKVLIVELLSGTDATWHYHKVGTETFIVMEGSLKMELKDGRQFIAKAGDIFFIPANMPHRPIALELTKIAMVSYPGRMEIPEDNITPPPPEEMDFWELEE